jgi:hypothetical protein
MMTTYHKPENFKVYFDQMTKINDDLSLGGEYDVLSTEEDYSRGLTSVVIDLGYEKTLTLQVNYGQLEHGAIAVMPGYTVAVAQTQGFSREQCLGLMKDLYGMQDLENDGEEVSIDAPLKELRRVAAAQMRQEFSYNVTANAERSNNAYARALARMWGQ